MGASMRWLGNRERLVAGLAFLLGLASIGAALAWQYIGGVIPSELAEQQRLSYYWGLPILGAALIFWCRLAVPWLYAAMAAVIGAFVWSTYLGFLHAGAEWGVWPNPVACVEPSDLGFDTAMIGIMPVECNVVQLRIFGLSLAGYNALVSLAIVLLLVLALTMRDRSAAIQPRLR